MTTGLTEGSYIQITGGLQIGQLVDRGSHDRDRGSHLGRTTAARRHARGPHTAAPRARVRVPRLRRGDPGLRVAGRVAADPPGRASCRSSGRRDRASPPCSGLLGVLDLPTSGTIRIAGQDVSPLDDPTRSKLRGRLDRLRLPAVPPDPPPHRARQRGDGAPLPRHPPEGTPGAGLRRAGPPRAWPTGPTTDRCRCRAASSSGWPWPGPSSPSPLMILADEPTGALDSANAAHVLEIFQGLQSPERAVVMVTHDHDGGLRRPTGMVSMRDGRIVGRRAPGGGGRDERLRRPPRRRLVGAPGPQDPHPAHHAGPDHRGGGHGQRGRPDRERQGRAAGRSCRRSGPTSSSPRPGGTFGSQNPTFPSDAVERVENVSTVTERVGHDQPVRSGRAAHPRGQHLLRGVSGAGAGRRRQPPGGARRAGHQRSLARQRRHPARTCTRWCSGRGSPSSTATCPGEIRTIQLNGTNFGVVGVLGSVALDPELDNAAFVTQWAAEERLQHQRRAQPALHPRACRAPPRQPPTPSRRPSIWAGRTRRRPRSRATCSKPRPRPTRPSSRWRSWPACWP